ncbi:MAG: SDR family oxidoreductase, partial [Candidatus Heimdallarchaeota archaeon]|nr:SDR family oxidoreductase [Candidatus Heimdallarchaeota archaeon]MCK5048451.1 SDR family oxidoreductase [Candidatus Heimdallarchaeota archaeon]
MKKSVIVTGASSGIGRAIAVHLAENGFLVFAGARNQQAIDELSSIENVTGIKLDVTNKEDIEKAYELISAEKNLYAIVNNAGIGVVRAILDLSLDDINKQFDVNLFGIHRMVRTFFPLLRETKGRIVNIGSINGMASPPLISAYSMSKFALEIYSEILLNEFHKFDIHVSIIDPGLFDTIIFEKLKDDIQTLCQLDSEYNEEYQKMLEFYNQPDPRRKDPVLVAERVLHALTSEKPHFRYIAGSKDEEKWL